MIKLSYHPPKSLGSLFALSIPFNSSDVKAFGCVRACLPKISSNFEGTNLKVTSQVSTRKCSIHIIFGKYLNKSHGWLSDI